MIRAAKAALAHLLALPITMLSLLLLVVIGPRLDAYLGDEESDQ